MSSRIGWTKAKPVIILVALAATTGALLWMSDDAQASHFWAGHLGWEPAAPVGGVPAVEVTGSLSFDPTFTPGIIVSGMVLPPQVVECGTYTVGTVIPAASGSSGSPYAYRQGLNWLGDLWLDTPSGDVILPFALKVEYVDAADHCRYSGKIVDPTGAPLIVPLPPTGESKLVWLLSARSDAPHVNNAGTPLVGVDARLATHISPLEVNLPPVVDFAAFTRITDHGAWGYGNHHCPEGAVCQFQVVATDGDGDPLTYRLATSMEASGGGIFRHPTGLRINGSTGLATWDTSVADANFGMPSEGQIWSTQIIVTDGKTQIPIDVMIEVGQPPEPCPDGTPRTVDPDNGDLVPCGDPCEADPSLPECSPEPPEPEEPQPSPPVDEAVTCPCEEDPHKIFAPEAQPIPGGVLAISGDMQGDERMIDGLDEDLTDRDSDRDGIDDIDDLCPDTPSILNIDTDGDGLGNECDLDDDQDGILDVDDACPLDPSDACFDGGLTASKITGGKHSDAAILKSEEVPERRNVFAAVKEDAAASSTSAIVMAGIIGAGLVFLLLVAAVGRRRD